jgi:aspartate aminotransferase
MSDPRALRPPEVHLNLNVRGLRPSATLSVQARCEALRRAGRQVFRLGLGQSPFPIPRPVVEALQAHAHEKAYLPVAGLPELRAAVAEYHFRTQRIAAAAEDVLIGPGSKELMFLLQLVYYGDLVIPTPAWVSYAPQAGIVGRKVSWVPTREEDGWRLTPEGLEALCHEDPDRPRIVILNYPANPTGTGYTADELAALAAIARDHRVVLLSDEIYGELHHRGEHVSVARYYPEGTIVSSGLSKWCGAGGWRLGTFLFPRSLRWLLDAMSAVASETFTSTSAPIQHAAVRAYEGGLRIERYLHLSRRILGVLGGALRRRLLDAGMRVAEPAGAFYLFPHVAEDLGRLRRPGIRTSPELCERLLEETGVAVLPGSEFGRPAGEWTFRLAYVDFDGARALAAAERLPDQDAIDEAFVRSHAEPVFEAVERVARFLGLEDPQ